MSQAESPVRAMFDVQRTAIRQGEQAFKQGLAAQRSANKMALAGLQGQESLQRQGLEVAQAATNAYMGASATMMGGRDVPDQRRTVDETFARVKEVHSEFFDAMERELDRAIEMFDELSDDYAEALDEGTDQLLESYQTIEDQSARNVDEFSEQLREQLERTQEMQAELEGQFERQSEQAEQLLAQQREQAEEFQERLEEEAEQMRRRIERQSQAAVGASEGRQAVGGQQGEERAESQSESEAGAEAEAEPERQLELIDGLGPTFRERLSEAGIRSLDDLVDADPDAVAEAADVSRERAEDWIEQAGA